MSIDVIILARNEERRITANLNSLPLDRADTRFHLVINGTSDRTADVARAYLSDQANAFVHDLPFGGKARSWNHAVSTLVDSEAEAIVFMDGDCTMAPGSIDAMLTTLAENPQANAISAAPLVGRNKDQYRQSLRQSSGIFGNLYLLRGSFIRAMRDQDILLPVGLIGDDSLVGALVKTDLRNEDYWLDSRIAFCEDAGFAFETMSPLRPEAWRMQYNRMISYAVRRYQNMLITQIMRGPGPSALPSDIATLYRQNEAMFTPRRSIQHFWFDHKARQRMMAALP